MTHDVIDNMFSFEYFLKMASQLSYQYITEVSFKQKHACYIQLNEKRHADNYFGHFVFNLAIFMSIHNLLQLNFHHMSLSICASTTSYYSYFVFLGTNFYIWGHFVPNEGEQFQHGF